MKNNFITAAVIIAAVVGPVSAPSADTVLVVSHPSMQSSLSEDQVRRIYMGKLSKLPDGSPATPLIVEHANTTHNQFARSVLRRSSNQLKSYWAKRLFTGKSKPPVTVKDFEEMKTLISQNKGYIGYILLSDSDDSVKTVFAASS